MAASCWPARDDFLQLPATTLHDYQPCMSVGTEVTQSVTMQLCHPNYMAVTQVALAACFVFCRLPQPRCEQSSRQRSSSCRHSWLTSSHNSTVLLRQLLPPWASVRTCGRGLWCWLGAVTAWRARSGQQWIPLIKGKVTGAVQLQWQ
jgi:hypothetical protein